MLSGANLLHIPYKTGSDSVAALVAGQVPVTYAILGSLGPQLRAGKVVPLARVGATRLESMPQVPALSELVPGFETPPAWQGIFGPAGLPQPLLRLIYTESMSALTSPAIRAKMADIGFDPITDTPEEFSAMIGRQIELVSRIARAAKFQPIE